ncbi:IS3 family transposase [Peribacillus simplex]|uniref:IS3 family transposase n=1 Tax=Peribacillus simplex TaxID=1478 RepID=A0A8B5Y4Z9_9BACI|nr:IS3 family transposase [Peribacillus simplex]
MRCNFSGIMKSELHYLKEFESVEHFKQELAKYREYYNQGKIKRHVPGTISSSCPTGRLTI